MVNGRGLTIEINALFPLLNELSLFPGVSCYYCILRLLEGFIWLLFQVLLIFGVYFRVFYVFHRLNW